MAKDDNKGSTIFSKLCFELKHSHNKAAFLIVLFVTLPAGVFKRGVEESTLNRGILIVDQHLGVCEASERPSFKL